MSTLVGLQESLVEWERPIAKPLDEVVWQTWVAKGRERDRRSRVARGDAVKWLSIATLLVGAGLWTQAAAYDIVVRFIVASGAIIVMYQQLQVRHYAFAAVFSALVLLYNPVALVVNFSGDWQRALVVTSAVPFIASLAWRTRGRHIMTKLITSKSVLLSFFLVGALSTATLAADLSKYRDFQLGADLPTIAKLTGMSTSEAKDIHRRPALIQELTWRPEPLGFSSKTEPVQEVIFSFYDGELFRIVVNYDRYETEGLTTEDMVEALSATYGTSVKPAAPPKAALDTYSKQEAVFARWQDPQYRFDLLRSSYGPSFKLVGVVKKMEAAAQAAIIEAGRLDDKEAPQRDAARIASEEEAGRAKLEKARLVNKPKFRP